jgi:hypothetical protein
MSPQKLDSLITAPTDAATRRSEDQCMFLVYSTQCTEVGFKYTVLRTVLKGAMIKHDFKILKHDSLLQKPIDIFF